MDALLLKRSIVKRLKYTLQTHRWILINKKCYKNVPSPVKKIPDIIKLLRRPKR